MPEEVQATQPVMIQDNTFNEYLAETHQLIDDMMNILENKTIWDEEKGMWRKQKGSTSFLDEKSAIIVRLIMRAALDKEVSTSLIQEHTAEEVAEGLIHRIDLLLMKNQEQNRLDQTERKNILYAIKLLLLAHINKSITWKMLEKLTEKRSVTENINRDTSTKNQVLPFMNQQGG